MQLAHGGLQQESAPLASLRRMTPERRRELQLLRRARDRIDRDFAQPLDVAAIAAAVHLSPAHFSRRFRAAYGESPHQYLMTRRIERACALLREGASVTDACMRVGCSSLGSFSRRFSDLVGTTPTAYRVAQHPAETLMPDCTARILTRRRVSRIGEARSSASA